MSPPMPLWIPSNLGEGIGRDLGILPASAIVGEFDLQAGRIMLDIEGNKYGHSNLTRYVERCFHAWDRHVNNYPTVARLWVMAHEIVRIGMFYPDERKVVIDALDAKRFAIWLGMDPVPEKELVW